MKSPDFPVFFTHDPFNHESKNNSIRTQVKLLFSCPEVRERYLADTVVGTITEVRPIDTDSFDTCSRFEIKYLIDGVLPAGGVVRKVNAKYAFRALGSVPQIGYTVLVKNANGAPQTITTYPQDSDPSSLEPIFEVEATVDAIEAERQLVKTILAAAPALLDSGHPSQQYVQ